LSGRLARLAGLAAGRYTPFLAAFWDEPEWEVVRRWRSGVELDASIDELHDAMVATYGDGWRGWAANLGRSGIQVALEALALPRGSEVIVPSFACAGVIVPVVQAGHRPVLVDVDSEFNLSFESLLRADSADVGAVIVPHFGGLWTRDAEAIFDWARTRDVAVIEDVAQAQGLSRQGRPAGSFGDVAVFSFGGGKLLFGPGGGYVLTRDPELARRIDGSLEQREPRESVRARVDAFVSRFVVPQRTRAHRELKDVLAARLGRSNAGLNPVADEADPHGFTVQAISDVEAALAAEQIRKLDTVVAAHAANAESWRRRLDGIPGVRVAPAENNVFTKLWVVFEGDDAELRATRARTVLRRHCVETETLYVPLNRRPEFSRYRAVPLPTTDRLWRSVFAVPARPGLDAADWQRIDAALEEIRSTSGR
jgi:perosamine synthetase